MAAGSSDDKPVKAPPCAAHQVSVRPAKHAGMLFLDQALDGSFVATNTFTLEAVVLDSGGAWSMEEVSATGGEHSPRSF